MHNTDSCVNVANDSPSTLTVSQIADMFDISYKACLSLVLAGHFKSYIEKRRRLIDSDSFENWYKSQNEFCKSSDLPPDQRKERFKSIAIREMPRLSLLTDKSSYSLQDLIVLLDMTKSEVRQLLYSGILPSIKVSGQYRVGREAISGWLNEQQMILEDFTSNGIHHTAGK